MAFAELSEKYLRYTGRNVIFKKKKNYSGGLEEISESLMTGGFSYAKG